MQKKTIIVAMSGGVDSSVSAYKMIEEGYNVIGATLNMGRCCDELAINDAKKICQTLNIEHYEIPIKDKFCSKIINYFYNEYINGKTPNPCAKCNREVKFKEMLNFMKEKNADYIATGHYAKIINNNGIYELHRSFDLAKDQSYFLSTLNYEFLQYIKFPLETIEKTQVRAIAKAINLHIAAKPDSQNACFIETNYKDFLKKNFNLEDKIGNIVDLKGNILGQHNGITNYTIGQRRGLNISGGRPLYVVGLDTLNNQVIIGYENDLLSTSLTIENLNILNDLMLNENEEFLFKSRSTKDGEIGKIKIENNASNLIGNIILTQQASSITKGQLCAIYKDSLVVGSGWIK